MQLMASKKLSLTSGYEDRISSLPDGVLCHILSFLPTEDSVRTRVLSTRWNHLFSLVPVLNFYYSSSSSSSVKSSLNSPSPTSSSCSSNSFVDFSTPKTSIPSDRLIRFLDFVDWVFNSYNSQHMDSFCFGSSQLLPEITPLLSWISESVRRRVHKLAINASLPKPLTLPRGVFTCETLTHLCIDGFATCNFILEVPEDVCLPRVRKLELLFLSFVDVASARRLFRSCPVLEDLLLNRCGTGDIYTLDISIPSLKSLTIFDGYEDNFNLVLDVPNVEKFVYHGGIVQHGSYSIQDLKLLMETNISFHTYSSEGYKALAKLFSVVCQVRHISFCDSTLEAFQRSGQSLPIFCNLTRLEIENISCLDSELVLDLLDSTPHLEVLEVENGGFSAEDYNESSHHIHFSAERVPVCVSLHLKEVEFESFLMLENEFKLVEYLLKNAKILDTFKIHFRGTLEKQVEMNKKLLTFSRWSRDCQIVLDLDMEEW